MGNKYIIEVEESYSRDGWPDENTPDVLYRVKGFNSLVFDGHGLNKLEKYDPKKEYDQGYNQGCADTEKENMLSVAEKCGYEKGYKKGLNDAYGYKKGYEKGLDDAWEAAKTIVNSPVTDHLKEIFGTTYAADVIPTIPVREAIYKLCIYEEKKKSDTEIRVGDEVQISTPMNTCRGVVLHVANKRGTKLVSVIQDNGFSIFNTRDNKIEKTGRHFPQVAELLEKMKEEYPSER